MGVGYDHWYVEEAEAEADLTGGSLWVLRCACGHSAGFCTWSAAQRAGHMHYYGCPKRFELPEDPKW